ncbi:MAG: hypothetical protein Ta2C_10500 [Candidatus Endomicrobiellum trichonymphae]|nr:MAG: hypothetical protein Ta2C_10500 [Candidatus Endomicrobium trichonymphae]
MLERYLKFQIYVADKYVLSENLFSNERLEKFISENI